MKPLVTEVPEVEIQEISEIIINDEHIGLYRRLDQLLAESYKELSRSLIKKLFDRGLITSEIKIDLKKMPPTGTTIRVSIPVPDDLNVLAENIPLDILFEDDHLIFINKAAGMVVHPAPGNYTGTLVNAILYHCPDLKGIGNVKRPGIVHRLDKGTTGVMVVAKDQQTHEGLVNLFSGHDINRVYETLIIGHKLEAEGKIESLIGRSPHNRLKMTTKVQKGKTAITHYKVISYYKHLAHVQVTLETGRTHQIRVHFSEILGRPLLNEPLYGNAVGQKKMLPALLAKQLKDYPHPLLHAKSLGLKHPITNEYLEFTADPPKVFQTILSMEQNES